MNVTIEVDHAPGKFAGYIVNAVRVSNEKFGMKETINIRSFLCPPAVGQNGAQYTKTLESKLFDANEFAQAVARFFDVKVSTL